MALTQIKLLAATPADEALAAAEPLADFDRNHDLLHPVSLGLLAQNLDKIDASPVLQRIEARLVEKVICGEAPGQRSSLWDGWFLAFITVFRMFSGSTEATVVAPSGMLHRRHVTHMSTDCGKEMNEKWLLQFARGAEIDDDFKFGHKACKTCFRYGGNQSAYQRDRAVSYNDFPELYAKASDLLRAYLRESLAKYGQELQKIPFKTNTVASCIEAKAKWGLYSYMSREQVKQALGGDRTLAASGFFNSFIPRAEKRLRYLIACELTERLQSVPADEGRAWLFRLCRQTEILKLAEQHYGSTEAIPMPEGEELAKLLAADSSISNAFETTILPTLLTTLWLDTVMPLVRERYPEGRNLPKPILAAYRLMPNRKPRHTNGTSRFNQTAFTNSLRNKMKSEGLDVTNLAAESYLDPQVIEAVLAGEEPDFTTFFTLHEFIHGHSHGYGQAVTATP